jgi:hypothetical protein
MIDEPNRQKELNEARERDRRQKAQETLKKYSTGKNQGRTQEAIKTAKELATMGTPWGLWGLISQISFSDWMYVLALFAAILKDLLDFAEASGFLYILVFITTFLTSIFIALMMLLGSFSNGSGRAQQKIIRSWLILLGGTTIELLFGINFLPIETLTVLIIYGFALLARKEAKDFSAKKNWSTGIIGAVS